MALVFDDVRWYLLALLALDALNESRRDEGVSPTNAGASMRRSEVPA